MNEPDDRARLLHMRDAAQQAAAFLEGAIRASLDEDTKLVFALVRAIEILGEAASKISTELREEHPEIPWPLIVGMRNRLIHAYFDVDLDILWETVTEHIPPLIEQVEAILAPPSQE